MSRTYHVSIWGFDAESGWFRVSTGGGVFAHSIEQAVELLAAKHAVYINRKPAGEFHCVKRSQLKATSLRPKGSTRGVWESNDGEYRLNITYAN